MTRYWSMTGTLEKTVWYFSPDGRVYQNLLHGFSKEDLAAHEGPKGTRTLEGDQMSVTWDGGKAVTTRLEPDQGKGSGFMWDMGIFSPVSPFEEGRSYAGVWEGGESLSHGGNRVIASQTLTLRADGTYSMSGAATVSGTTERSTLEGGSVGPVSEGTWRAAGYSMTLSGSDGKTTRRIAFPYDDEETPVNPDRIFFGGRMFKRVE
jgi:hypothetical protein